MRKVVVVIFGVVVLAGCSDEVSVSQQQGATTDELSAHDGEVCPEELPQTSNTDHGFGTADVAELSPSLASPDAAWVCRYVPVDVGAGFDGGGPMLSWQRDGEARPVEPSGLGTLERHLDDLEPADEGRSCNDDLGPRWMLVYAYEGDLTGVVVDDYGCQDVRLTDEPFQTPPGEAAQPGTVSGVLTSPDDFLDALQAVK